METPIAAIDVGSNSMRVAVIRADCHGYLEVVEESRAVPRLIRDVQSNGELSRASMDRVIDVLRDFQVIAHGAGAAQTIAVATSAVRDATNSAELVERVREALDLELQVISGLEEARLAFLGAVHSLPVERGLVVDVGGGSMEVVRFEDRRPVASWTLQLGAVRLTDRFITSDPPTQQQVRALRKHVTEQIRKAGIPPLEAGDHVVGTGGTIRNLAKIDRAQHLYPLPRLHGYTVTQARLREVSALLRTSKLAQRIAMEGLNEDRADTIVAGALVVQAVLDALQAPAIVVAGQGLREGIVIRTCSDMLPDIATLRATVLARDIERFAPDRLNAAARRAAIIDVLRTVTGGPDDLEMTEALATAAAVLDFGRSIDYYGRHRHTENLLLARGLAGFTHREQALVCALIRQAGQERYDPVAYRPLVTVEDSAALARASTLLAAADEIEQRTRDDTAIHVSRAEDELGVTVELPHDWDGGVLRRRFARSFGLNLVVNTSGV
jgi:exopolyphosphatase/guanosine-5'-triphosphate,3'-diphosphate pyrophosphatase